MTSTALGRSTRIPPSAATRASQPPGVPMTCSWVVTAVLLGTAAALLVAILFAPRW